MKKFLIIFLLATSLFAQYTKSDFRLIKTTATREFDRKIILDYFKSDKPQMIAAGLLSAAHSADTSFVKDIIKINFAQNGEYICFALGQLGASSASADYLYKKLNSAGASKYTHQIFDALGKVANDDMAKEILDKAAQDKNFSCDGISIFIFNIYSRKISVDKSVVRQILLAEIKNDDEQRRLESLFSIARIGGIKEAEKDLVDILNSNDKVNSPQTKSLAVGCFARQKYFPNNKKLISLMLTNKDWRIKVEAAKALSLFSYTTKQQIKDYFKLISDPNPNVSRQAATSIRNIKTTKVLSAYLNKLIEPCLLKSKTNSVTKGELFISYSVLNPEKIMTSIKKYEKVIDDKYIFEVLQNASVPAKEVFAYLSKKINKKEKDILDLAPALLGLQKKLADDKTYNSHLLNFLDSKYSSVSSTFADGIDSGFVSRNSSKIIKIVTSQIKTHKDDARYYETLISMGNLSEKIGRDYMRETLDLMRGSDLFAVQQYLDQKTGISTNAKKTFSNLESIWKNSFAFSKAKVKTEKGEFTIKFYPEYAPLSVGNFITLSKKGFYDNVVFHRVVPDFVAQTGDSTGTGFGGPGYDIVSEFSVLPFNTNYVGMASAGKDTEGSQWYVMHNIALHLYGKYSTFGKVISGMDVIPKINQGDKIIDIQLIK